MKKDSAGRAGSLRIALLLSVAGAGLATPAIVSAQEQEEIAAPADEYVEEVGQGNQIVVTATKREQTLQDVPVAVSVTTGETIERAGIRDLKDLQTLLPSLRITQLQSSANTNFFIRGFGNGANNAGIEPSVGVFVDGVYRSRTASQINDLPNVSRIEVLRGPQSTLFGKNASAGVISIVTQEPQFTPGGSVEATYGNYNAATVKGYVTGPVSDNVAMSIAGGYSSRDGYNRDLNTGNRTNERNRWFVRGQTLIEPSSDLKIRLIADYDSIDENCCGVVNLQPSTATGVIGLLGGQVPDFNDPFADVVYNNFDSTSDVENYGFSGQIDYNIGALGLTSITSYRKSHVITAQDPDFSSADLIYPIAADVALDTFTQEFRLTAQFADMFSGLLGVFYINESVDQTGQLKWGADASPYANFLVQGLSGGALNIPMLEQTFGALEGDPTKYVGEFFKNDTGFDEAYTLGSEAISIFGQLDFEITDGLTLTLGGNFTHDSKDFSANLNSSDIFSTIDLDAPQYAPFRQQLLLAGGLQQAGVDPTDMAAVFAFATAPATMPIYNNIVAFAAGNANNPAANPLGPLGALQFLPPFLNIPNSVENGKVSDNDFSYTARLAYDFGDINVYASYATGFKAASVNLSRDSRPLPADAAALGAAGLVRTNQTYGTRFALPEESTVFEFGMKGNWDGVSANFAVFHQAIKDFQSNIFTGSGFALANAGKQSTFGVEFDGMVQPADGLTLNLAVTYLDPTFDSFELSTVGDLTGTRPGDISTWAIVIGGQYDHEFGNGDHAILNASFNHESDTQNVEGLAGFLEDGQDAAIAAAAQFIRSVDDLSASLTYVMDSGLEVSVWGRNILNNRYILRVFDSVAQPRSISGYTNEPRTYGGTVRFKW